ncbi:MAG: prefoldin subunit alpha [Candidatus Bathyarchaeia archaeon]
MASKSEEELRKLSVEMRFLEQTAEAIQARINAVNAIITDLTYASMTLEGLEKEKENAELLVPIGGNSYIKAKLETPDKIIVGMGAGISIEKTLQEAKEIIKKRLESLEKTRDSLQQQLAQIAEKIGEDREKFESLIAEARERKAVKDV